MAFDRAHTKALIPFDADAIEQRAAALVNPASGLANDFLNVYNEIVMLLEFIPRMPDLIDEALAWEPVSYEVYFARSDLPGHTAALDAYAVLPMRFRALFDQLIQEMATLAADTVRKIEAVQKSFAGDAIFVIESICADACARLRRLLDLATQVTNGRIVDDYDLQESVNRTFATAE